MRSLITLAVAACLAAAANAHFVFVYVPAGGTEARVVFGHTATPDPKSFPTRAEKTTLTSRDAAWKDARLTLEKVDGNYFRATLTGQPVVVFGTTEAGVVQRGDAEPVLAWYYPKVILGDPFAKSGTVGKALPMEIVPVQDGAKVRFRVLADGKPVGDIEVTVGLPGKDEDHAEPCKTDTDGLTPAFSDTGRYCVAARKSEDKSGDAGGKAYKAVRHTATLVFDYDRRGK